MKKDIGFKSVDGKKWSFNLWAPFATSVQIEILDSHDTVFALKKDLCGYWRGLSDTIRPGALYWLHIDGIKRPDPVSLFQPQGVHGPSQVVDLNTLVWNDEAWSGIPLDEMIIYELHLGTFTLDGTFLSAVSRLSHLKKLGVNAIELMPVAQFPGKRNWGYDGVFPFAVQNSYGGPEGLCQFVNACHEAGIAVIMDVVYNHLGPEGNYLGDFGPYFTDVYQTPWGRAINFDAPYCDAVRNYFIQNALMWFRDYHIDALRLDAVHAIIDRSAKHFLWELTQDVAQLSSELGRQCYLIAESDLNDTRLIQSPDKGGYGLDAQWSDDFHHSLHALLTQERHGYYEDFGRMDHLSKAFSHTFVYDGVYSSYRKKTFGNEAVHFPGRQFVVCSQNHDQIGNRRDGDRLSHLLPFEALKLIAGIVILSPYVPLLFMGEEFGAKTPFLYFVDHSDPGLIQAVRDGRQKEFESFAWEGACPDPQSETTFQKSQLVWDDLEGEPQSKALFAYYRFVIGLRREHRVFKNLNKANMRLHHDDDTHVWSCHRWQDNEHMFLLGNFSPRPQSSIFKEKGVWQKMMDSSDQTWQGPNTAISHTNLAENDTIRIFPHSLHVYVKEIS